NIRIPNDEQGGRLDRTNGLHWPVLDLAVQLLLLGEESGKILRMRCDAAAAFRVGNFSAKRELEVPSEKNSGSAGLDRSTCCMLSLPQRHLGCQAREARSLQNFDRSHVPARVYRPG